MHCSYCTAHSACALKTVLWKLCTAHTLYCTALSALFTLHCSNALLVPHLSYCTIHNCNVQTSLHKLHCKNCTAQTALLKLLCKNLTALSKMYCAHCTAYTALHVHYCSVQTLLHKSHCTNCAAQAALYTLHWLYCPSAHCMHAVMNSAERLHGMHTSLQNYHAQTSLHCTNCTVHTALLILYTTVVLHSKMQWYNNAMVDFTVQISSLSSSVCVHGPSRLA